MKRYLLFAGSKKSYCDPGGWTDYIGSADSVDELIAEARIYVNDNRGMSGEVTWGHIVDSVTEEIVKRYKNE